MDFSVICVDDNDKSLKKTAAMVSAASEVLPDKLDVVTFTEGTEALVYMSEQNVDIAVIDAGLSDIDVLTLAKRMTEIKPDISLIFVAETEEYALKALKLHVSGYIIKPLDKDELSRELMYAIMTRQRNSSSHVIVQTFGEFNVYTDGKVVNFARSKAKELLAFLIDRQGGNMARAFIFSALWEDRAYDRSMQKQLDVIIRSLRQTLIDYSIADIVEMSKGQMRVCPEKFTCDLYQLFAGDKSAIDSYRGEYMSAYSWASATEAYIDRIFGEM
ncbi:MAG: response regulator [Lachnospiraceae bacterium]|nr:response regulator [Lachnospiraceae bacterium]